MLSGVKRAGLSRPGHRNVAEERPVRRGELLATPPFWVMTAQHSASNSWHRAYVSRLLSASSKPWVSECGTVSTCDGGRVAVGAPSVHRRWLRAYVLRLEERMHIQGRHVTHRLERLEELVVACASVTACTAAMRRGSADCQRCGPTRSLGQCAERSESELPHRQA